MKPEEPEEKEMNIGGDLADEQALRQQIWLENAKEEDEYDERNHSDLIHCKLCNKLFILMALVSSGAKTVKNNNLPAQK